MLELYQSTYGWANATQGKQDCHIPKNPHAGKYLFIYVRTDGLLLRAILYGGMGV